MHQRGPNQCTITGGVSALSTCEDPSAGRRHLLRADAGMHRCCILVLLIFLAHLSSAESSFLTGNGTGASWKFQLPANYSHRQRPLRDQTQPITVSYKITIIQLIALDEKQQEMCCKVWIDQEWQDDFIQWSHENDSEYRPEWMAFRPGEIWTPDIAIDNSISVERENFDIKVFGNGDVWWSMPAITRTTCYIKTEYFPFDKQQCEIIVGSWYYPPNELNLVVQNNATEMELKYAAKNAQWEFIDSAIHVKDETHETYDMVFRTLLFKVRFRRKSLYYCLILIVPYVLISCVSVANFILPCESGEKIALGVTVLLSQFVNLLNLVDLIPESSDSFPILGLYYLFSMALCAFSVILTVFILNIHFQADNSKRLPKVFRLIFLQYLRIIFLPGTKYKLPESTKSYLARNTSSVNSHLNKYSHNRTGKIGGGDDDSSWDWMNHTEVVNHSNSATHAIKHIRSSSSHNRFPLLANDASSDRSSDQRQTNWRSGRIRYLPNASSDDIHSSQNAHNFEEEPSESFSKPPPSEARSVLMVRLLGEIRTTMEELLDSRLQEERDSSIIEEWRIMARVVDRILGLIYVALFFSVFAFLDYDSLS